MLGITSLTLDTAQLDNVDFFDEFYPQTAYADKLLYAFEEIHAKILQRITTTVGITFDVQRDSELGHFIDTSLIRQNIITDEEAEEVMSLVQKLKSCNSV